AQYSTEKIHVIKTAKYILTPDSLSKQLTANYKTDREKVTSIFRWITENISYNVRPFYSANRKYSNDILLDEDDDTAALKPLSERVAIDVLNKRVAFCDGYARLFKTLCDYADIKSEIITGYANGSMGRAMYKFGSNHRWNAVYLDSSWQLLDATWASGHLTYSTNDFIQSYNNRYFLTQAKDFVADHYPEDLQWTLLPEPPEKSEFRQTPFKTHAFLKNYVISFSPQSGVIEASEGDTLRFEIETFVEKKNLLVLDTAIVDSADIAAATADIFKNTSIVAGNKIKYRYIIPSSEDKWLSIVMNDELIMRYKLNIRKNYTASK
ncbi:MAG: transglutaminase domain-containing protein, partial [Segetibacter sp.]